MTDKMPERIWARNFDAPQYQGTFFKYEPDDPRALEYICKRWLVEQLESMKRTTKVGCDHIIARNATINEILEIINDR